MIKKTVNLSGWLRLGLAGSMRNELSRHQWRWVVAIVLVVVGAGAVVAPADDVEDVFIRPPSAAKPWVYWQGDRICT